MAIELNPNSGNIGTNSTNQSTGITNDQNTQANEQTEKKQTSQSVTLTNVARQLKAIEKQIMDLPDVDKAKVDKIKQAIASGTYLIDDSKLSKNMLLKEFPELFTN